MEKLQKKCNHEFVTFVETIDAFHTRVFEGMDYFNNNEYGMAREVHVHCNQCHINIVITNNNQSEQPEWILKRIDKMRINNEWFLD